MRSNLDIFQIYYFEDKNFLKIMHERNVCNDQSL